MVYMTKKKMLLACEEPMRLADGIKMLQKVFPETVQWQDNL